MNKFFQEFFWIALSKGFAGAGAIVINLVILNRIGTEAFGAYSLCLAGILLADGVIGSAFDVAVMKLATEARSDDLGKSYNIERSGLLMKLALILGAAVVVVYFSRPLSQLLFHNAASMNLIQAGCVAAIGLLSLRSMQVHLQIDRRFAVYGGLDFVHSCLRFGGIVFTLWFISPNPIFLILVIAVAALIVFFVSLVTVCRRILDSQPGFFQDSWELASFVRWSLLTTGVATFGRQLDVLLLSSQSDISEVGIFSAGTIFAVIPDMFGMYLSVIISPRIMRYISDGSILAFYQRVQGALLIGAVVTLIVGLLGIVLVNHYLLPEQYARSASVLAILWPGALAGTVSFPLALGIVMFVRPSFLFKLELIILPITVVFYLLAIDQYGAIGAAWVTSVSRLVKAVIVGIVAWRLAQAMFHSASASHLKDKPEP